MTMYGQDMLQAVAGLYPGTEKPDWYNADILAAELARRVLALEEEVRAIRELTLESLSGDH
jgi:hypothetical protein